MQKTIMICDGCEKEMTDDYIEVMSFMGVHRISCQCCSMKCAEKVLIKKRKEQEEATQEGRKK